MGRAAFLLIGLLLVSWGTTRAQATRQVSALGPGKVLVADHGLRDPNFGRTVVLLVRQGARGGAFGLVLNRRTDVRLRDALPDLTGPGRRRWLHVGGPVEPHGLSVLIAERVPGREVRRVLDGIYFSRSRDVVETLAGEERRAYRAFSGYAGWAPGQLEQEIERGDWWVLEVDAITILDPDPDTLWQRLVPRDPSLSTSVGRPAAPGRLAPRGGRDGRPLGRFSGILSG